MFIDETWTKTNMAPLRGWAPRGERLKAKVPHRRWKTMTFLAALRLDRVEAPWLIDGPINGERFRLYVEKVLLPTLRPDDLVVIDNLGSHRGKAIRRIIRSVGARLFFLPKYSPYLNPIEQLFAKPKHWLRKAAKRTAEAVSHAIGQTLDTVASAECRNYFSNSGYQSALNTDPRLEWAPGAGQVGGVELTGAPGFRRMEAHDEASIPQYRVQTPDCPGVLGW